jgi:xanthine/uracil permease
MGAFCKAIHLVISVLFLNICMWCGALLQSTGGFYALSRLAGATPPPPYVISRGIGWQGVGLLLNGFFGTFTGATVAPENIGLVGLTRVGSRRVIQISAFFMLFFSIFGKFGGILAAIPQPIVAAILCITFGMVGKCNS